MTPEEHREAEIRYKEQYLKLRDRNHSDWIRFARDLKTIITLFGISTFSAFIIWMLSS